MTASRRRPRWRAKFLDSGAPAVDPLPGSAASYIQQARGATPPCLGRRARRSLMRGSRIIFFAALAVVVVVAGALVGFAAKRGRTEELFEIKPGLLGAKT